MTLKQDKNKEALLLWEILFYCEIYSQLRTGSEKERRQFLENKLVIYKNKKFVFSKLKMILRSNNIEQYFVAVHNSLFEIKF